ncbi:putative peptidase M22 [Desulforapulum autotrophicum HRM2]|uniref:Peptidase M22 n=1 Tax=Desulforapulum autotrophicum (strain ATCC 43914 / DSM 3382 / VKM B-1955 / HRM2) TaxID=177437 RepID=C0QKN2_DESAH|nr:tRNA (adenosine(37)-N6)-threonylcarbamoyltransferase complex dimerization subunit type 1 TsaB [Desulforapulum autotrophicum]ACN16122.1 putative peptidase M22 [Desulforapulum autotrophicum HRM2]
MKIVAVNTSETSASVALVEDSRLVCEEFFSSRITHSRVIMEMIHSMLSTRAGIPLSEIDGFVAARGPGSFTGLRIGISVVKGIAYAASKPVAGISSLDAIAWQVATSDRTVCALMDAKRGEVYTACYRFSKGRMIHKSEEVCVTPEQAVSLAGGAALYVGSGVEAYHKEIDVLAPKEASFAPQFQNQVRASALAHALFQTPELLSKDPLSLLPVYIRRSDAEINYDRHPDRFC